MALLDQVKATLDTLRTFSPRNLKSLGQAKLFDVLEQEAARARVALEEMQRKYPSADQKELAQRFIDRRKNIATVAGGITGVFGVTTVPLDLVGMIYLQLGLLAEIGTVFHSNLKTPSGKEELLELFGYSNGIGPMGRSSPRLIGSVASALLTRGGFKVLGRAVPLIAAPVSAYLNQQHVQLIGDAAVRHYSGWIEANKKRP